MRGGLYVVSRSHRLSAVYNTHRRLSRCVSGTLRALLERNGRYVDSLADDHFADVQGGQSPEVVSVCCPDSRVSQEGIWDVEEPGWLFTPSTVGNQVWDVYDGEKVVDGSVIYPIEYTGTRTVAVVGHTGCGAVTAALDAVRGKGDTDPHAGVEKWIETLVPVVQEGLEKIDPEADGTVDRLVQHNVDSQVRFLLESDEIPDDVDVYGFVYDLHGTYGGERGRAYLVNANGITDIEYLHDAVPDGFEKIAVRL